MSKAYYYANATLWWGIGIGIVGLMVVISILVEMDDFNLSAFQELRRLEIAELLFTPIFLYYTLVFGYKKLVPTPILFVGEVFIEICTRLRPRRIDYGDIESCQIIQHEKAASIFEYGYRKEKKRERLEIVYNKGGSQKTFKIRPAFIRGDVREAVALINAKILNSDELETG